MSARPLRPPLDAVRDVARREGVTRKDKKAPSLANPKEQKATQRREMRREENGKKSRSTGNEEVGGGAGGRGEEETP